MTQVEQDRQTQNVEHYQIPKHADTMPSPSTQTKPGPSIIRDALNDRESGENRGSAEKSQDSGAGTSDTTKVDQEIKSEEEAKAEDLEKPTSTDIESHSQNGKPRRRKMHIPFVHKKKEEEETGVPKKRPTLFKRSKEGQQFTAMSQIKATLFNSYVNILLVFVPVGIAVNYADVKPVAVFIINFIAIIPLAGMLSYATEEIALRTGETIGGLLNATFGNAVELIVSIIALIGDQVDIVQESLIGSMLSNLLLVMGMCFFFGGITRVKQNFNVTVAQTASSLLALAIGSLIIPAAFQSWADGTRKSFLSITTT